MRIQKYLAQLGFGSRRHIEQLICQKNVRVNGLVIDLGYQCKPGDMINIGSKQVVYDPSNDHFEPSVLMYHKPVGLISSRSDPEQRQTVFGQLPAIKQGRWVMVGRLDINTSGLLLFTNDGQLANRLMHPKFSMTRTYHVRVFGPIKDHILTSMKQGINLSDGIAKVDYIKAMTTSKSMNQWFEMRVSEGRNRIIRRLWEHFDCQVNQLIRVGYANLSLPNALKPGQYKPLTKTQIKKLYHDVSA